MSVPVLVPVDGSDPATAGLEHALEIAASDGSTVHVLHVANTNRDSVSRIGGEVVDVLEREGDEIVSAALERAENRGVTAVGEVLQGDPRETILEYADKFGVGRIVMGTGGRRGVREHLLGSVTERVVRTADVPVLAVRNAPDVRTTYPYETVLVPIDGSPHVGLALDRAIETADRHDSQLHVLSVVDVTGMGADTRIEATTDALETTARRRVEEAADTATAAGLDDVAATVRTGSIHREIIRYARSCESDLLVMGTHGRGGLDRFLLGSVTERVLRTAPAPVLTVRATETDASGEK